MKKQASKNNYDCCFQEKSLQLIIPIFLKTHSNFSQNWSVSVYSETSYATVLPKIQKNQLNSGSIQRVFFQWLLILFSY